MTGKTHQVIGQLVGVSLFCAVTDGHYHPATGAAVAIVSSISALLPDIDTPAAQIWRYLPFGLGRIGSQVVHPFLQHRNLTHSLLGAALIGTGLWQLAQHVPVYWGINVLLVWVISMAGYFSHLSADAVTVEGIPIFFPLGRSFGFPPRPFQSLRIETGKWFENFVVYPLVILMLTEVIILHWQLLRATFILS